LPNSQPQNSKQIYEIAEQGSAATFH